MDPVDAFVAVADQNRRHLLDLLLDQARPAGHLVKALPSLTQPAVSRHLRMLRAAGLVTVQPVAQRRIYLLRPEGLTELDEWLGKYRPHIVTRHDLPYL